MPLTLADAADLLEAAVLAVAVLAARRQPTYRALPAVLAADLASDAAQRGLALVYRGTRAPGEHYAGAMRVAFHAAQLAHLAFPCLALALAWYALLPTMSRLRSPWPVLALWAALGGVAVLAYPYHAPDLPSPVYAVAQGLCVAVEVALVAAWVWRADGLTPLRWAALCVVAGEVALLGGPYLAGWATGSDAAAAWDLAAISRVPMWLALGVVSWRTWRPGSPSLPSAPSARSRSWH